VNTEARSEERLEMPCGCKSDLLQCNLVEWIMITSGELVDDLEQNKPWRYPKYHASTKHSCAFRTQIYEWKHIYQSRLRQFINNPTLLPLFSLDSQPHLEPHLLQDTLIVGC